MTSRSTSTAVSPLVPSSPTSKWSSTCDIEASRRSHFVRLSLLLLCCLLSAGTAAAQPIAFDMVGSSSQNLMSFTNNAPSFSSLADGFQKYQRGVSPTIPFAIADDSNGTFPPDNQGIVDATNVDEFFGAADTINGDNPSGAVTADWIFDVSTATAPLALSIDIGAMGDFESSDVFEWSYSFDGAPFAAAFTSSVDEATDLTYVLAGGDSFTLNDPMTLNGALLNNVLTPFVTALSGSGSTLTIRLSVTTNGGNEAFAFQNLIIAEATTDVLISELMYNPRSSEDTWEWVEITNNSVLPLDLTGWVIDDGNSVAHSGSNIAAGTVAPWGTAVLYNADDVSATDFEAAWGSGINLVPVTNWGAMALNNGGDRVALWSNFSDYAGDHSTHANAIVAVDYDDSGDWPTDDGNGSIFLVDLSADANDGSNWQLSSVGLATPNFSAYESRNDGGNSGADIGSPGPADFPAPMFTELEIFEIQGSGESSLEEGNSVRTLSNVVTALSDDGYFIQTPTARTDGDPDTSDGIFAFTGGAPTVAVGDLVDTEGTVAEFFGLTEIQVSSTTVVGGGPLPAPVAFDAAVPSPDPTSPSCSIEFECYEGMLVRVANGVVTGPSQSFGSDPIAEAYISAGDRSFREPGIEFPGLPGLPVWDGNPEVFEIDPDRLGLPNLALHAGTTFEATGVLGFEFGGYELWPAQFSVLSEPVLPGPVSDAEVSELTIGTLNVLRLFNDVDDPSGDDDSAVTPTAEYQLRLAKLAAHIVDVLRAPGILAVQEVENLDSLSDLANAINALDPTIGYSAELIGINGRGGINIGFLVRPFVVVESLTQLGADEILTFDGSPLHDRPPLLLEARCTAGGTDFPVSVLGVHGRSLGGIDSASSGPRVRQKRLEQSESIAAMVQDIQTANPEVKLVVTGDFNAFEFSDGYVDVIGTIAGDFDPSVNLLSGTDVVDPNLTVETTAGFVPAEDRYSFIFRGNSQVLDHALTSSALSPLVTGFEFGRGNVDVSERIFLLDPTTPLASTDHDGAVLFVLKDSDLDGVLDGIDQCPGTVIPEAVTNLGVQRWALMDEDVEFDTTPPRGNGQGNGDSFTIEETAGCSCTQIVEARGLGNGHLKFGCSTGVMREWVASAGSR